MNPRLRNVLIRMIVSVLVFAYVGYFAFKTLPYFDFLVIMAFFAVFFTWSVIETALYRDPETAAIEDDDRKSYTYLQLSSLLVLFYSLFDFTTYHWSRLTAAEPAIIYFGFVIFIVNCLVRYAALTRLGSMFNPRVALYQEHHLIDSGIYQYIRHPMYLSAILNTIAISLIFSSLGALAIILVGVLPSVRYRIILEEEFMLRHFPEQYGAYIQRSKRLIPGIW